MARLMFGFTAVVALAAAGVACAAGGTSGADGGTSGTDGGSEGTSDGGTGTVARCAPGAQCAAADATCLGLVDNKGKTSFGLRMSEFHLTAPTALATGVINATIANGVTPSLPSCNLTGGGTFSWLLQFDTAAGTIETGGAKPVADPTQGYSFDDETLTFGASTFHVQPATLQATPDASGSFAVTTGTDLNLPIFLDAAGSSVVLLPLHQARLATGTLSSNDDCIGSYNAATLDPDNSCQPDSTHPQFTTAGTVDGYITLEEADTVTIATLQESLCVVLSGNAAMYGTTAAGSGVTVCKRDASNNIVYQGQWCSTTNAAASAGCADAEPFAGNFAASSVLIH